MMFSKLKTKGILGMNARVGRYMYPLNPRKNYPLVDDKVITSKLAVDHGIPMPENYRVFESYGQLKPLKKILSEYPAFVIKPARGSMGNGIIVIHRCSDEGYIKTSGKVLSADELRYHCLQIIGGLYSLNNLPDKVILQYMVKLDPVFESFAHQGVPDIRVIVYQGFPIMAMTRLPTKESDGRANLHQGAVGAGIDFVTGQVTSAEVKDKIVTHHPDTGRLLTELRIPFIRQILEISAKCYEMTGLGYLGVDVVIDAERGPLVLEMNARPGLSIQVANLKGLRGVLNQFDAKIDAAARRLTSQGRVDFSIGVINQTDC